MNIMAYGRKWRKRTTKPKRKSAPRKKEVVKGDRTSVRRLLKTNAVLYPIQGGTVSNYIYQYLSPRHDPAGIVSVTQLPEFLLWAKMYDRFRINAVHMRVIPRANVNLTLDTVDNSQNNSSGVYYVAQDRDGAAPSSVRGIKRYAGCKTYSMLKGCKSTYKLKYPKAFWFDSQDPNQANQQGIVESLGLQGGITIYGENFPEPAGSITNNYWADMEITFDVSFNTYNPRNISVADGVVSLQNADDVENLEFSLVSLQLNDTDVVDGIPNVSG